MHYKNWVCVSIIILFFSTATANASGGYTVGTDPILTNVTSAGGYTVGTSPLPGNFSNSAGADGTWSFWQVPLWMQIACISSALVGLFALLKISPLIFGKILDALDNWNRKKIYGHVQTHPGSTASDISREEGMNLGTVKYHIGILEAAHKITTKHINKNVRIFQNSSEYGEKEKIVTSALAVPARKSIILSLMDNPGMTNRQIATMMGISDSGSYQHMKRLLDEKIVSMECDGGIKKYYVNGDVKEILGKPPK